MLVIKHHALGAARRAGRVAQRGQVAETGGGGGARRVVPPQGQELGPRHHPVLRHGPLEKRNHGQLGLELGQSLEQLRRADEEEPRAARLQNRVEVGGRAGIVERQTDRADQADGDVEDEIARAVQADQGDAVAALDSQRAQRIRGREHIAPHLSRAVPDDLTLDNVVVSYAAVRAPQAINDLLVHGAVRTVHEALKSSVI